MREVRKKESRISGFFCWSDQWDELCCPYPDEGLQSCLGSEREDKEFNLDM